MFDKLIPYVPIMIIGVLAAAVILATWSKLRRLQRRQQDMQRQLERLGERLSLALQMQEKTINLQKSAAAQHTQEIQRALDTSQAQAAAHLGEMRQWMIERFDQLQQSMGKVNAPEQPSVTYPEACLQMVQRAIDGEPGALRQLQQTIQNDAGVRRIGVADMRKYQNNAHYAEFTPQNTGECLLIPLNDAARQCIALPYPGDPDWFVRNHELLSRLFSFTGDWTNTGKAAVIQRAALVKEKVMTTEHSSAPVYALVQPGVLEFL